MGSKIKVLIINQYGSTPVYSSGAGERHYYIANNFAEKGFDFTIVAGGFNHLFLKYPPTSKMFNFETINGGRFIWIKLRKYKDNSFVGKAISWLEFLIKLFLFPVKKDNIPDVVVVSSMSLFPTIFAVYLRWRYKIPFILEIRDIWPLTPIQLGGYSKNNPFIVLFSLLEKFAYTKADVFISVLPSFTKHLKTIIATNKQVYWIPNAINHLEIQIENFNKIKIEQKFKIIYTGALGIANSMNCLIESAKILQNQKEILFEIIGNGPEKETLKKQAAGLNNIVFREKVPKNKVVKLLIESDVCFISWHDIQMYDYGVSANKYNDYMLAAKPIISASNIPDDPVLLANCGFRVESGNSSAIVESIMKLYKMKKEKRDSLGLNGFNYLMKHNTYSQISNQYEECLNEVISNFNKGI